MRYFLPDKAYQVLKWLGLVACPAVAIFLGVLGGAWGWDAEPWVLTVNGLGVLIGVLIGASHLTAKPDDDGGE